MIYCPECNKVMEHVQTDGQYHGMKMERFECPNKCCTATRETMFHDFKALPESESDRRP